VVVIYTYKNKKALMLSHQGSYIISIKR